MTDNKQVLHNKISVFQLANLTILQEFGILQLTFLGAVFACSSVPRTPRPKFTRALAFSFSFLLNVSCPVYIKGVVVSHHFLASCVRVAPALRHSSLASAACDVTYAVRLLPVKRRGVLVVCLFSALVCVEHAFSARPACSGSLRPRPIQSVRSIPGTDTYLG